MDDHHRSCMPLDSSKPNDTFAQLRCGDQDRQVHTGARTTTSTMMRVQVPSMCILPSTMTMRQVPLPPSTTTSVDRQVPLRFVETGKSEDPKYHSDRCCGPRSRERLPHQNAKYMDTPSFSPNVCTTTVAPKTLDARTSTERNAKYHYRRVRLLPR